MAKKQWTDEERKAFGEKMRAARAKREAEKATPQNPTVNLTVEEQAPEPEQTVLSTPAAEAPQPDLSAVPTETISTDDVAAMVRYIKELEAQAWRTSQQAQPQAISGPQLGAGGKLLGTTERYSLDRSRYNDPTEQLKAEPALARFAFPINYDLLWDISDLAYETIDHIRYIEPKFTISLIKKIVDEFTGEDTGRRYKITSMILFEDPETALSMARELGMEINENDEVNFMNAMRYERIKEWLFECFYPAQRQRTGETSESVVDNRLVQFYNESVPEGTGINIPFDKMPKFKV